MIIKKHYVVYLRIIIYIATIRRYTIKNTWTSSNSICAIGVYSNAVCVFNYVVHNLDITYHRH